jgi:Uma2 family endonuclease
MRRSAGTPQKSEEPGDLNLKECVEYIASELPFRPRETESLGSKIILKGGAMAAATTFVTVEEYLRSSFEPDAEYINGQIEERAVGENDHSAWQGAIYFWFQQQAQKDQIRARTELRVQVAPTSFLVPDVTLLSRNLPIEQIVTHPPIAVFEILSPTDTLKRVMAKCGQYEHMGIQTILFIDPDGPRYQYAAGRLEPLQARAFDLPGCSARFDLDEIEKLID